MLTKIGVFRFTFEPLWILKSSQAILMISPLKKSHLGYTLTIKTAIRVPEPLELDPNPPVTQEVG